MSPSRFSASRAWLLGVTLSWCGAAALAADHRHSFSGGLLLVSIDSGWSQITEFPEEYHDAVGFRVGDGSLMQWTLVPGTGAPAGSGANGNLRIMTMQLKRALEQQTTDISDEPLPLSGTGVKGYYVRAVDPNPGPGEWKFMYTGWVSVGETPVMFNIVWNQGGQAAADRALASVKNLRIMAR